MAQHLIYRQTTQKEIKQLPYIEQRMACNNYLSRAAKIKDENFIRFVRAKMAIHNWCELHYDEFIVSIDNPKVRKRTIQIPKFDTALRKFVPIETTMSITRCHENYADAWKNIGADYDWVYVNDNFRQQRLDWQEEIFADILEHQNDIEQWCDEYTKIVYSTEMFYKDIRL